MRRRQKWHGLKRKNGIRRRRKGKERKEGCVKGKRRMKVIRNNWRDCWKNNNMKGTDKNILPWRKWRKGMVLVQNWKAERREERLGLIQKEGGSFWRGLISNDAHTMGLHYYFSHRVKSRLDQIVADTHIHVHACRVAAVYCTHCTRKRSVISPPIIINASPLPFFSIQIQYASFACIGLDTEESRWLSHLSFCLCSMCVMCYLERVSRGQICT